MLAVVKAVDKLSVQLEGYKHVTNPISIQKSKKQNKTKKLNTSSTSLFRGRPKAPVEVEGHRGQSSSI